ncbi:MAG: glycoside hydrolase family 15 protein, partial [Chloroflexi bacterium]|nr:glycoside hydrolase family 15 protein [Chloroflexota bacterium]
QEAVFVLSYSDSSSPVYEDSLTPTERQDATEAFWRDIVADTAYQGPWPKEVERSYLALHLLTYVASGAIVAAPTTSLPEAIGGVRNWDYRYTWLRDAAFTVEALMSLGHVEEATGFFRWLCEICTECAERDNIQVMFRVDGDTRLEEETLEHLAGYKASRPVRIGNAAFSQRQHDIYGDVLASAQLLASHGGSIDDGDWALLRMLANMAARYWREPDNGIWEVRGGPYHFVYSKVMCWVALDRAVRLAETTGRVSEETHRWAREMDVIKEEVLSKGWNERKQAFVRHFDTDAMDASNLLIPLTGFLPADDPRVVSTVERIRAELGRGPFLHRYRTAETDDGLVGPEGAFTLCSFWLVRVLAQMGRAEEAQHLFEQLLMLASPLGLYAEMADPKTKEALGNYPQAFTHIGLILAVQELRQSHTVPGDKP